MADLSPFHSWSAASPYALALGLAALLCVVLAIVGWRRRAQPGGLAFVFMMSAGAIWALLYSFELTTQALEGKVLWAKTEYLGIAVVPLAWLLFARGYTGAAKKLSGRVTTMLVLIPVLTVVLAATFELQGLMWSRASVSHAGSFPSLVLVHGPWFWVFTVYSYGLLATGTVLLLQITLRYPWIYRAQAVMLVVGTAAPWIGNALSLFVFLPRGGIDVTPFAFAFTGVALLLTRSRLRLFSLLPALLPTARSQLLQRMGDAVLVVDVEGRVATFNPAAQALLSPGLDIAGRSLADILGPEILLPPASGAVSDVRFELSLGEGDSLRYFDVASSPLGLGGGIRMGQLLVFRDITRRTQAEAAVRRSEERFRAIVEQFAEGFFLVDDHGLIREWNPAMEEVTGRKREEVLGKAAWDVAAGLMVDGHVAETSERMKATVLEALRTGSAPYFGKAIDAVIQRQNGETRQIQEIAFPVRTEDRLNIGHVLQDVTERKAAEEELRESEERFRGVFEQGSVGIALLDSCQRFVHANATFCDMVAYREEDLAGMTIADITAAEDMQLSLENTDALYAGTIPVLRRDKRYLRKDGGFVWGHVSAALIRDTNGNPMGSVAMVQDITERKQAEEAASRASQYNRSLIEAAIDPLVTIGPDGKITDVNAATMKITGRSREELVSSDFCDYFTDPENARKGYAEVFAKGSVTDYPLTILGRDGRLTEVLYNSSLYRDQEENVLGVIAVARDITERKRAQDALKESEEQLRQAQKMEAVGQLAGGIAHDFNNLLTAIIGNSSLAVATMAPEDPNRELITEVQAVGERAAALTRQILAFSRRQMLRPVVLCLNNVILDLEPLFRRSLGEDIELELILAPELRESEVDPHQIGQVLLNLALNARDAMPEGGRLVIESANARLDRAHCRENPGLASGDHVVLTVSDSGCGMDSSTQARIFEPFFTTKEVGKGTGLGLSTAYGIVRQSGGSISVSSRPGVGSNFKVYLPAAEASPASLAGADQDQDSCRLGSERVLVVEDEPSVSKLVVRVLSQAGYDVITAASAEQAEAVLDAQGGLPDLLLTDVVLPGGTNGRQLAESLLGHLPGLRVLFMSGYTRNAAVSNGHLDPSFAFLEKPFTPESLLGKVREVLDGSTDDGTERASAPHAAR